MEPGTGLFGSDSLPRRLLQLDGSAESIALGTAFGLFVAMTPTVGVQMIIILLISLVLPIHRIAGLIMVYVSNPLTVVPIYWFDYWVGLKCLAQEGLTRTNFELLYQEAASQANEVGWFEGGLELLRSIGNDALGPLFLGGAIVGLICGLPAYPITLRFVRRYRARKRVGSEDSSLEVADARVPGTDEKESSV